MLVAKQETELPSSVIRGVSGRLFYFISFYSRVGRLSVFFSFIEKVMD